MPIARRPPLTDSRSINVLITDGVANLGLLAGQAVALFDVLGVQKVVLASASDADAYLGFAKVGVSTGANVIVTSGRGSRVTPEVEGGGALTPNQPVYLAVTPGKVTQDTSTLVGYSMLKLGYAITATEIILKTDYAPQIPTQMT